MAYPMQMYLTNDRDIYKAKNNGSDGYVVLFATQNSSLNFFLNTLEKS